MPIKPPNPEQFLTSEELATRHHVGDSFIRKQRHLGKGPPYVRFYGRILYRKTDVEKWEAKHLGAPQETKVKKSKKTGKSAKSA